MCNEYRTRQINARKARIRRRLDRHYYGRRPFRWTRGNALGIAAGLMLLVLCGTAAFLQSTSNPTQVTYRVPPAQ